MHQMHELFGDSTPHSSVSVLFLTEEEENEFSPSYELMARVHRALAVRDTLAVSPLLSCEEAAPALLPASGDLGVIVPWRKPSGSGTARRSGADLLALFGLHAAQAPGPWAPSPITACLPLSRLGDWSAEQNMLKHLLACCPGWDGVTRSADAEPHWVVLRSQEAPEAVGAGASFGRIPGPGDVEVFGAYLVAVLQRLIAEVYA